jgi:AcrR family transcriptional regulator
MKDSRESAVRETIIRESMKLFLARGFRGTSVKEITAAAGIARGTLYWYFSSKEEVLKGILEKFDREFVEGLRQAIGQAIGNFTNKYKIFHKFATEFARDHRDLALVFNALLNEIVGTGTEAEKVTMAVYERFRLVIEGMLEEARRDGSIKADIDPAIYAHIILASHTGMLVQWFVAGPSLSMPAFTRAFQDFILRGVAENHFDDKIRR